MELLNQQLSHVASSPSPPHSDRERLQTLAISIAERYKNQPKGHSAGRQLSQTFFLLLDIMQFFDHYHSKRIDVALDVSHLSSLLILWKFSNIGPPSKSKGRGLLCGGLSSNNQFQPNLRGGPWELVNNYYIPKGGPLCGGHLQILYATNPSHANLRGDHCVVYSYLPLCLLRGIYPGEQTILVLDSYTQSMYFFFICR